MNRLNQAIEAWARCPDWGPDWVRGQVIISPGAVRFRSEAGEREVAMDQVQAEVQVGDEETIVLTAPSDNLEVRVSEMDLLNCPVEPLRAARAAHFEKMSRGEMRRRTKVLAWCALVVALLTVLGSWSMSWVVRVVASRVPPERDAKFGAEAIAEMKAEQRFLDDTNAVARMAELADPLFQVFPQIFRANGLHLHLVADADPNAFALPGGHVVVTTGMLELADAEELLGVLAHELAHVSERHIYRQAIASAGPLAAGGMMVGRSPLGTVLGGGAALLIGAGFSQEYESEADTVGWEALVKANISPQGMIRLFAKLKTLEDGAGGDVIPQAFRSHPAMAKRLRALETRWSKLRRHDRFRELPSGPVREVLRPSAPH